MNGWKNARISSITGVFTPARSAIPLYMETFRDVLREVAVREIRHPSTALLLHWALEAFEAVVRIETLRESGCISDLPGINRLDVRLDGWYLIRLASTRMTFANCFP